MAVIRANETSDFKLHGYVMRRFIAPSTGANEIMLWLAEMDIGAESTIHYHDHEEAVMILDGEIQVNMGDVTYVLSAGDAYLVPANIIHQVKNTGSRKYRSIIAMLVNTRFFSPNGVEIPAPPWTK